MDKVSIVIPTYNNLKLFKNSLFSVIHQKGVDLEIVVVDDSSNNDIDKFLRTEIKDNRIKYYKNKPSKGPVKNWNYGISLATGDFINLLHHDEFYQDSSFQLAQNIKAMIQDKQDVIVSRVNVFRPDGSYYTHFLNTRVKSFLINWMPSILMLYNFIGPVSCLIFSKKKKVLFNENLVWLVDVEWYLRIIKKSKVNFVNHSIMNSILKHDGKITDKINIEKEFLNDLKFLRKEFDLFSFEFLFILSHWLKIKIKSFL